MTTSAFTTVALRPEKNTLAIFVGGGRTIELGLAAPDCCPECQCGHIVKVLREVLYARHETASAERTVGTLAAPTQDQTEHILKALRGQDVDIRRLGPFTGLVPPKKTKAKETLSLEDLDL